MGNFLKTFTFLAKSSLENIPCLLLQVVESRGSSPGRGGFCMGVNLLGEMAGSIGGGMMEHKLVETAKAFLKRTENTQLVFPQIHNKAATKNQSGMICSGEQTVLLYQIKPSDLFEIQELIQSELRHIPTPFIICPDGIFRKQNNGFRIAWKQTNETDWEYQGIAGKKPLLHIVGGGHCSLALSQLMKILDFRIHLYETRANINTLMQNHFADEIKLLGSYSELSQHLMDCRDDLVVVMTFGYRTDDEAIRAIRSLEFSWLGLLGSKSKIARMMEDYRNEGFSEAWLSHISAPVGIAIRSQTPEEIAVSIAAEIIGFRNKNL